MSPKDFVLLKQWLTDAGCVVFYLEHPFLGRPGDNQFEFLEAKLQVDTGVFTFSGDLQMEIIKPSKLHISKFYIELQSIENLRVIWREDNVVLLGTSLRIDV